ncbi:MAG: sigma-70 family RNA polymerase sigma factor [Lachnospiraceae bacterium]|nr:sigma-70 family RNA polymerase sigma factor [Lachnospiraceae bacterium]
MRMLIRRAQKYDKDAFTELMLALGPDMYKIARTILRNDEDAADAMQETALICWEKIGTLQKEEYFKTWMTRILINCCNEILRTRRRTILNESLPEPSREEPSYTGVEWKQVLGCLEEPYRVLIVLYYMEGFKTREIARILDLNENTVRGRLKKAREKVRLLLEEDGSRERIVPFHYQKKEGRI